MRILVRRLVGRSCAVAWAYAIVAGAAHAAEPASVIAPTLKVGDSWTLQETNERGPSGFSRTRQETSIVRLNADSMVVAMKTEGAPTAPQQRIMGLDWGLKLAASDGEQKTTAQPLSFPLKVGESWTADWVDSRRQGNQISAHFRKTYKVVGWEDVTVPAGTFHALKIEAHGSGDADMIIPSVAQSTAVAGGGSGTAISHVQAGGSGKVHVTTFAIIYYAPEVKHPVKTVDEQYNGSEVMTRRDTEELVSYKLME